MSLNDFQRTNAVGPDTLFSMPQGSSQTYAPADTPPKQVIVEPLALTRLPVAMRTMGWDTAAALMQRWFESPAWQMPDEWKQPKTQPDSMSLSKAQCDESIVKMAWAMKYERCRKAVEVAESRLTTPNAAMRLKSLLKKSGWQGQNAFELGFYNMSALHMDAFSQVNFSQFGETWDVLDDMYGALGNATLKIGVAGKAYTEESYTTNPTRHYFYVEHVGFYIRDYYDFNGLQYLGTWAQDRVLTKTETAAAFSPAGQLILHMKNGPFAAVTNSDFREYRDKTSKGGDYIIYSDILWKKADHVIDLGTWA
ncbi:hypothetical protein M2401_000469 [Pseudomonas sp. JUb42]|jgi:hypothetical protein|uniref:DUF6402 family protein n=1 Tax=Pseudomonas sp. JUb42 TaxID=2940611 RepID=UPI00216977F6|nr:DUF6402 family protein [Pseudomonas sp. JUb42]MCS3466759.1 hypothetical protein [Pseudomonas sp. JUb42]